MSKDRYEVVVGNIGTVYTGTSLIGATQKFNMYRKDSIERYGRASDVPVTLFKNGEVLQEHLGHGRDF